MIFIFIFLLLSNFASAQTYNYIHYTTEDGLASSNVYVAFQDSKGFMWLSTENGVNRFDGKSFDTYTTETGLADNDVLRIFEDSKGRIWFLTIGGHLSYFKNGRVFNEKSDPYLKEAFTGAGFYFAFEDSKKRIWFCSYNAVVAMLDGDKIIRIKIEHSYPDYGACADEDIKGVVHIYSFDRKYIFNDTDKKIYDDGVFPTESQASYFRIPNGSIYFSSTDGVYKILKGTVSKCMSYDEFNRNGYIIATGDSMDNLYLSDRQGSYFLGFNSSGKGVLRKYLENEWVNSTSVDNEGNLWFLTRRNGVYILPWQSRENKLFNSTSLLSENIYSLTSDDLGRIWIGCSDGKIAYLHNDSIHNLVLSGLMINESNVHDLEKDRKGNIWGCSDANFFKICLDSKKNNSEIKIKTNIQGQRTLNISFNSKNEPIVSCPLYTIKVTEKEEDLFISLVKDAEYYRRNNFVFYDNTDKLYISNVAGVFEKTGDSIVKFGDNELTIQSKVLSITQTTDSTLIFATDGNGLLLYKNGHFVKQLTMKNGLLSDICRRVRAFNNKIFVCTLKGLSTFNLYNDSAGNFVNYSKSNGLPSNDVRDVVSLGDILYVGTIKGLSVINTKQKDKSLNPPALYIRSVKNISGAIEWSKSFNLEYDKNDLSISYNAITFSNSENVLYEYSLGHDTSDWKKVVSTELIFPNLPSGHYIFMIRAKRNASIWSTPQAFSFFVEPPFYKTWWFESIVILSFFGGLSLILIYLNRRRMRVQFLIMEKRNALNMERNRISADMHDDLGSDLSRISVMAELMKLPVRTEEENRTRLNKISEFVTEARKKLDDIIWAINPTNDSIGSLTAYINQYCLNYFEGTGTHVNIQYELSSPDVRLNARHRRNIFLIIKEVANNTLKHAEAKNFNLYISANEKEVAIRIGDDGIGLSEDRRREFSNGLKNIEKRIRELNGKVEIFSEKGQGTRYEILFPLNGAI